MLRIVSNLEPIREETMQTLTVPLGHAGNWQQGGKRQRAAAVQKLRQLGAPRSERQRFGVRQSSATFVQARRNVLARPYAWPNFFGMFAPGDLFDLSQTEHA